MIKRFCQFGLRLTLFFSLFIAATTSVRSQSTNDLEALNKEVLQLTQQGKHGEAIPVALRALAVAERQFAPDDPQLIMWIERLANLYVFQGQYDQAEPLFKRALAVTEKVRGGSSSAAAELSRLYRFQNRYAESEQLLRAALESREKTFGSEDVGLCSWLNWLAVLYEIQYRFGDAEPFRKRCLSIREKAMGGDDPSVGQSLHELAKLYRMQDRGLEADPLYSRAILILGPNHPEAILTAIKAGDYFRAARSLGIEQSAAQQVHRTFYGQVTELVWTDYAADLVKRRELSGQRIEGTIYISGEAVHGNMLWAPFLQRMERHGAEWVLGNIANQGLAHKK
jgi:tetratricopeptide (TPR) repeat protein